jgi:hypothetical protein
MTSDGMIYIPGLMTLGSGILVILRVLPDSLRGCSVGITDERVLSCTPFTWPQMAQCIHIVL